MAINPAHKVLTLADHMINGEIAYRKGDLDMAVVELNEAVKIEDELLYMEPPDWLIPARHALGAVLVSAGRLRQAEDVYRADLKYWPDNGWSLYGLWKCMEARRRS
jgi:tetratricopeptide (TPR) repeat protein